MRSNIFAWILMGLATVPISATARTSFHSPIQATNESGQRSSDDDLLVPSTRPTEAAPLSEADLSAYLGGMVPLQLSRGDLAGAAVIIIQDGHVLAKKGYGFADVKRGVPVDPDATMFRVASISKLMTYVSTMQLVEQGRLDLDADINRYLDFKIQDAFGKPITLRHLMTHTAGFEHQQEYILQRETDTRIPLRDYLVRYQPKRIYPPGTIGSYSNYGVGLMGYIVQHVSGERFEDYVQHHIFDPLAMTHSTFEQPLQPALRGLLSQGYFSAAKGPGDFEVFNPAPAGALSATLADLARFSQTLLNGGEWDGHRVLRPETVQEMWTRQFSVSPALPAMCMGFYEVERNGMRFVGHNGDTRLFHSQVEIQPEKKLIILSAFNSSGADSSGEETARWEILNGFLDRYFPFDAEPAWKNVDARAREIEGTFTMARRTESGRVKLASLLEQTEIRINDAGELISNATDDRGHKIKLRYLGDDLWQNEVGEGRLMALRDQSGHVTRLASMFGAMMMIRVPWWEDDRFVLPLAAFGLVVSGLVVFGMMLRLLRLLFPAKRAKTVAPHVPLTATQRLAALIWIPAVPVLLLIFHHIAREPLPRFDQVPYYFLLQNILVALAILLSIPSIILAIQVTSRADAPIRSKLKHGAVGSGYAFLIWFSLHWHLIGSISRY